MTRGNRAARARAAGAVCAAAASLALLGACSGGSGAASSTPDGAERTERAARAADDPSPSRSRELSEDQRERKDLVSATEVGWEKAARTAEKKVSGSTLVEIELGDGDDGGGDGDDGDGGGGKVTPVWEAEVATEDGTSHDIRVDAVSGKVTRAEKDDGQDADDRKKTADRLAQAKVTPVKAAAAAAGHQKGTVTGVSLDDADGGPTVWAVDIVSRGTWAKTTFDVDAGNGRVLHEHVDRD
ncbi:peptidase M4 [Streptomyces sp. SID5785]|uniref:PepSY domain-containing protein n=1 Tax=Streptomyces sp. SID5785 TaxID=2690309 RepID=UPI001360D8EB|nr:peptidase M4 [Streptomyces sp. SID5785]